MKDSRSLDQAAQEVLRIKSVKALIAGKSQNEVAEIFDVSLRSVNSWWKTYRSLGLPGLRKKSRRPKSADEGGKLKGWQCSSIVRTIMSKTPDQLEFGFMLWTRDAVAELIKDRFKVRLSKWTVGRLLKQWGMSPQKPVKKAYQQQPEVVKEWLDKEYPRIARKAAQEKAEIQWGDEMGVRSDDQIGRTYGKIGQTPVVKVSGQRFSCQMISTVSNRGTLRFMIFDGKFNANVCITFLKRLIKDAKRKIFLILDGHPVHKSKKIKSWIAANAAKISLFVLPAYSPELNPDELLNQDVKTNAVRKKRAANKDELKRNLVGYLRGRQKRPDLVRRYFEAKHVRYAV
ncbi:MAG: IS630 family transposase [Bdellovibrionales bacterium]|nr:IS630 family transposase [Bdellovibrionales bacterium]